MERRNAVVNELVGCPAVRGSAECGRPLLLHVTIARRPRGFYVAISVGRLFSVNLDAPSCVIRGSSGQLSLRRVPGRRGPDRADLISPRRIRISGMRVLCQLVPEAESACPKRLYGSRSFRDRDFAAVIVD